MGNSKILLLFVLFLFGTVFAQSDYEYVRQFKSEAQKLKNAVAQAETYKEIGTLRAKIDKFRKKYYPRKDFLNEAIYPEKFETILTELDNSLERRKSEIAKLDKANAKIKELSAYLEKLSTGYMNATAEIELLKEKIKNNESNRELYDRKIAYLKKNIAERDSLLRNVLSSFLKVEERTAENNSGSDISKKELKINVGDENFLEHLKTLLNDNIKFLAYAKPDEKEIFSIYDEQKNLTENLNKLNADALSKITGNENVNFELDEVKNLNEVWGKSIERKISQLVAQDFSQFNIDLPDSVEIAALYDAIVDYAEKESVKAGNRYEREHKFKTFSESAWNGIFKRKWAKELLQRGLITVDQISAVDLLIENWEKRLEKSPPYLLYILVTVIVMFITIYIGATAKKSKFKRKAVAQKKKNEYEKLKREKEIAKYKEKKERENK